MDFALETLSLFESRFDVDLDSWRLAFFEDWGTVVNKSYESLLARAAARQKIAMYAFQVGSGIFKRGNKDIAEKVFLLGIEFFKKNGAGDVAAFARDVLKDLYGQREDQVSKITNEIAANPNQPDKSLLLGKLLCFEQLNWSKGRPLLAKSNSPKLKQAARMDLYADTDEEFELTADHWWDLSDSTTNPKHSAAMRMRAGNLYGKLLNEASDLKKKKYQNRINSVGSAESLKDLYRNSCNCNHGLVTNTLTGQRTLNASYNRFGISEKTAFRNASLSDYNLRQSGALTILVWFRGHQPNIKIGAIRMDFINGYNEFVQLNQSSKDVHRQFAFVYDRGELKTVINGKVTFVYYPTTTPDSSKITRLQSTGGHASNKIRIYDRSLTEKEIRRIYVFECFPPDFYDLLNK